jgi:hypothetical protein
METAQIAAMSELFSSQVIREMARIGRSAKFARLARQSRLIDLVRPSDPVCSLFDVAFSRLKERGFRDEYVYKSILARKILFGRHSLRTACLLNEFRAGNCKADIVILNGTSTVYEVKSERDSLMRLERQLQAYREVFASVCVVAAEEHAAAILEMAPEDVGLLCLRQDRIATIRVTKDCPHRTNPLMIFNSLRTQEAKLVLEAAGIAIPQLPNTKIHAALRELFIKLHPRDAHAGMVEILRKTRNLVSLSTLISQLPESLHMAALSVPLRRTDRSRLVAAANTRLADAVKWA